MTYRAGIQHSHVVLKIGRGSGADSNRAESSIVVIGPHVDEAIGGDGGDGGVGDGGVGGIECRCRLDSAGVRHETQLIIDRNSAKEGFKCTSRTVHLLLNLLRRPLDRPDFPCQTGELVLQGGEAASGLSSRHCRLECSNFLR